MNPSPRLTRRALVTGALWAAPTAAVSIAAPALAASTTSAPGLNGWVQVRSSCGFRSQTLEIDGRGTYPARGLWAEPASSSQRPTNARITVYFPASLGTLRWSAATGSSGWSVPEVDAAAPAISGYLAYTTRYTGDWTYDAVNRRQVAMGQPHFTTTFSTRSCVSVTAYALRSVQIGGTTYEFRRGPVTLASSSFRSSTAERGTGAQSDASSTASPQEQGVLEESSARV
ncbi:hypothetical protein [Brachybacterium hainanense]|uniref:Tat pathway signal sequence domain protein n=1 Tax=Brachybacterium hainanense TaxID=1541174 RepID=A0ABV6RJ89_9MICO